MGENLPIPTRQRPIAAAGSETGGGLPFMPEPVPSNLKIAASVTALLRALLVAPPDPQLTFKSSGDSYRSTSTGTPRICSRAFRNSISDNVPTRPSWLSSPTGSRARDNEAAESSRKTFKAGTRLGTEPTNRSLTHSQRDAIFAV